MSNITLTVLTDKTMIKGIFDFDFRVKGGWFCFDLFFISSISNKSLRDIVNRLSSYISLLSLNLCLSPILFTSQHNLIFSMKDVH